MKVLNKETKTLLQREYNRLSLKFLNDEITEKEKERLRYLDETLHGGYACV